MFGTGLILFLLNKEIYVMGPETVHAAVALGLFIYGIKKLGPGIAEWADKKREVRSGSGTVSQRLFSMTNDKI